jgi:hypothetical protein
VIACHCRLCRRNTGSFVHATAARLKDFRLMEQRGLAWYRSSAAAQRGFYGICGANLFWQADGAPRISVMAGTLDDPGALRLVRHIFAGDKGGYYRIEDGVPQRGDGEHGVTIPPA